MGARQLALPPERLGRQWVGIDISIKAYELVKERLNKDIKGDLPLLNWDKEINFSTNAPARTDSGKDSRKKKYVYIISHQKYHGEYKVGIASNVKSRLTSYQTADPNRAYKLEYSYHTLNFREIEQYIHGKYENKHEWVSAELEQIKRDIVRGTAKIK